MMSEVQQAAVPTAFPLVIPTLANRPLAKLLLRNEAGQIVQQWLIRHNKATLGSASSCNLRCVLPGLAPYHALLVIGAKQTFIRALAPKLSRDGMPANELLLGVDNANFEIAGHRFELLLNWRESEGHEASNDKLEQSRLKFTLARPFALQNRPNRVAADSATSQPAGPAPESDPTWVAKLVHAALEPLELQIQNALTPIAELQAESRRQKRLRKRRMVQLRKKREEEKEAAAASPPADPLVEVKQQLERVAVQQSASIESIQHRIAEVNHQLQMVERLVAEERAATSVSNEQLGQHFQLQSHSSSLLEAQHATLDQFRVTLTEQRHQLAQQLEALNRQAETLASLNSSVNAQAGQFDSQAQSIQQILDALRVQSQQLTETLNSQSEQRNAFESKNNDRLDRIDGEVQRLSSLVSEQIEAAITQWSGRHSELHSEEVVWKQAVASQLDAIQSRLAAAVTNSPSNSQLSSLMSVVEGIQSAQSFSQTTLNHWQADFQQQLTELQQALATRLHEPVDSQWAAAIVDRLAAMDERLFQAQVESNAWKSEVIGQLTTLGERLTADSRVMVPLPTEVDPNQSADLASGVSRLIQELPIDQPTDRPVEPPIDRYAEQDPFATTDDAAELQLPVEYIHEAPSGPYYFVSDHEAPAEAFQHTARFESHDPPVDVPVGVSNQAAQVEQWPGLDKHSSLPTSVSVDEANRTLHEQSSLEFDGWGVAPLPTDAEALDDADGATLDGSDNLSNANAGWPTWTVAEQRYEAVEANVSDLSHDDEVREANLFDEPGGEFIETQFPYPAASRLVEDAFYGLQHGAELSEDDHSGPDTADFEDVRQAMLQSADHCEELDNPLAFGVEPPIANGLRPAANLVEHEEAVEDAFYGLQHGAELSEDHHSGPDTADFEDVRQAMLQSADHYEELDNPLAFDVEPPMVNGLRPAANLVEHEEAAEDAFYGLQRGAELSEDDHTGPDTADFEDVRQAMLQSADHYEELDNPLAFDVEPPIANGLRPAANLVEHEEAAEDAFYGLQHGAELSEDDHSGPDTADSEDVRQAMLPSADHYEELDNPLAFDVEPPIANGLRPAANLVEHEEAVEDAFYGLRRGAELSEDDHSGPDTADFEDVRQAMLQSADHYEELDNPLAVDEPQILPSPAPSAQVGQPEEEDSVEDYMRKLLARMRGVPEDQVQMPLAQHSPSASRSQGGQSASKPVAGDNAGSVASASQSAPVTTAWSSSSTERASTMVATDSIDATLPFDPDKYVPRALAPEASRGLNAMRELANTNARTAIYKSSRQRYATSVIVKLSVSCVALIVGVALLAINGLQVNIGLIAAIASLVVSAIWGFDGIHSLKPLLQAGLILKSPVRAAGQGAIPTRANDLSEV
jgi:hypothetical protein